MKFLIDYLIDSHWVLTNSTLSVTTIAKQHIKNITFLQNNCLHCGQMFSFVIRIIQ